MYDTTVQSVTSRVVNKKAGGTTTIYEVIDSDGNKWATFKNTIANEANRLINQAVQIQGRIEQNGAFQNYMIDDIRLGTGAQQRAQNPIQQAQQSQPPQHQGTQQIQQHPDPISSAGPTDKDWQIARAVAVKVSAQLSEDAKSFWMNLDSLVVYLMLGLKPPEYEGAGNTLRNDTPEREPNQFIPETSYSDPGRESPFGDTDGDIPF